MHSFLLNYLIDKIDHLHGRVLVAANEDRHVRNTIKQERIAHQRNRRSIDDDIVVPLTQLRKQRIQTLCLQQLRRVRRNSAARYQIQILMLAARNDDIVYRHIRLSQIIGQMTFGIQVEIESQHRFADIESHQRHFLTQERQREGGVAGDIGFAFAVDTRSHQDHRRFGLCRKHKTQVGTYQPEELRRNGRFAFADSDVRMTRVLHDLTQHRCFESLLVLLHVIDLVVKQLIQIQQSRRNHQPEEQTDDQQVT